MNKYFLNPCWLVSGSQDHVLFASETQRITLRFQDSEVDIAKLMMQLREGYQHSLLLSASVMERGIVCGLQQNNIVLQVTSTDEHLLGKAEFGYLLNSIAGPVAHIAELENKCVAIFGLGGSGTIALQHLVGVGIRKYVLLDCDQVEGSNLNRQFIYNRKDIGRKKLTSLPTT